MAEAYVVIPYHPRDTAGGEDAEAAIYAKAIEAANRALALDPDSSAALAARANARYVHDFDWRGAEEDFRAAIAADPHDVTAHQWYAELLLIQRRWQESEAQYATALAIDPLAAVVIFSHGTMQEFRGDAAAALASYDAALKLDPGLLVAQNGRIGALIELRRYDEAERMIESKPEPMRSVMLAVAAALRDPARKPAAIERIMKDDRNFVIAKPNHLAMLGAYDLALGELEREFDAQAPFRELANCLPSFNALRADPRFQALLKRINLPVEPVPAGRP
jgi:tetratricopeptide (TPR) repeat protein